MSDEEWAFFAPFVIETGPRRGRRPRDHRVEMDKVFWIARTGSPWRLKHSRTVATRYDKTTDSYIGYFLVDCIRMCARQLSTEPSLSEYYRLVNHENDV